jgi:hypothetical protein
MAVSSFLQGLPAGQALNNAKDRILAKGAKAQFNKLIEGYGAVLDFQLNTVNRSLSVELLLRGEQTPIEIHVHEYTLSTVEGKSVLQIDGRKINTSREWLSQLFHKQVGDKPFVVPDNLEWLVHLLR